MSPLPARFDVFGTEVSLTTVDEVVDHLMERRPEGLRIIIANVHSVMSSRRRRDLARVIADSEIVTPDGVPLVWALKAAGHTTATRVTGIDVMYTCVDRGRSSGLAHYFYGSTDEVLDGMVSSLEERYPGVVVAGTLSPPFHEATEAELDAHARLILESGAEVVWVGLGMPKQEHWMGRMRDRLPGVSLIGVGAAFDWVAGRVKMAPQWMRDRGLEWLYRLALEPRRMWRRYIYNNPAFLVLLIGRWLRGWGRRLAGRRAS